ncbi:MAG: HD family hydrolase [Myxococcota bacterium]
MTSDAEAILELLRQADLLEALPRTGYLYSRVPQPESVAAHAYGVCLVALVLTDAIAKRPDPPELDRAVVLEMAILHDMAEALITDIPSPIKRFMGRTQVKDAERRALMSMVDQVEPRYLKLWDRYEAGACLESRVVHVADTIQMMVKVLQYEAAGLGDLRRFWNNAAGFNDRGIPEARAILDRIRAYHDDGDWPGGL